MKIIVWHGYLLRGTGSNIYVSNLSRFLVKEGHELIVFSQDNQAGTLDYVTEFHNVRENIKTSKEISFSGKCKVIVPDIGNLLAVYVQDDYEGFDTVKTMLDLGEEERNNYIYRNVSALKAAVEEFSPDFVMTNHAVLSPFIALEALKGTGVKYFSYLHNSAIEYTVKKSDLYFDYAVKGLQGAARIMVGSSYLAEESFKLFKDAIPNYMEKLFTMPAGVDLELFKLDNSRKEIVRILSESLAEYEGVSMSREHRNNLTEKADVDNLEDVIKSVHSQFDYHLPEEEFRTKNLDFNPHLFDDEYVNVFYLGKFIPQKGVHLLFAVFAEALVKGEKINFTLAGFGKYREHYELMLHALGTGNRKLLDKILSLGPYFKSLREYYQQQNDDYFEAISKTDLREKIFFTGKVNHAEASVLLPIMDVMFVPSMLPEAFGMVAIEGMACGVFPVMSYFSGLKDVADAGERFLDKELFELTKISMDDPLSSIRENFYKIMEIEHKHDKNLKKTLREIVNKNFTWSSIIKTMVDKYKEIG